MWGCKWETQQGVFGKRGCTHAFHRFSFLSPSVSVSSRPSLSLQTSQLLQLPSLPSTSSSPCLFLHRSPTAGGLRAEGLLCRCSLFLHPLCLSSAVSSEDHIHISALGYSLKYKSFSDAYFKPALFHLTFRPLSYHTHTHTVAHSRCMHRHTQQQF